MFKKTLISLAVASSVGLTGCFGGGESGANANPDYRISNPAIDGKVWPRFNPVKGELPIPNDLIFQSDDLETVNVNEADGTFSVADSTPPVTSALNKLSGASTVAPIDIAMSGTIDASSVDGQPFLVDASGELVLQSGVAVPNPNQNVFLLELDYASGDPLQGLSLGEPPTIPLAQPFAALAAGDTSVVGTANALARQAVDQYEVSVIEQVVDEVPRSVIRINMLEPLNPKKRYLVVVTKGITADGEPIIASPNYSNLTDENAPLGASTLAPVRRIINSFWEPVAEGYFALPNSARQAKSLPSLSASDIAFTVSVTTSNDEEILPYMAQPDKWFADQLRALTRLGAVRKVAGAASVLSKVADGDTLEAALKSMRKSDKEVGPNDTNRNGEIDALDFDFNNDGNLTSADFNLVSTGDTADSPFNYFDVKQAVSLAENTFPSAALQAALPAAYGSSGACNAASGFEAKTSCGGQVLATGFASLLPKVGDKSASITLETLSASSSIAGLLTPALSSIPGSDTAVVLNGSISLPYYLGVPSGADGSVISTSTWTADHTLAQQLNTSFGALGLQLAQGVESPKTGTFASDAVNYVYPFPSKTGTSDVKVPMLVMVPRPGATTDGGFTWNGTDQLPVVVFQHGITTDRSAALSVGSFLTAMGFGVVAIDLPLHGVDAQDNSDKTSGKTQEQQALAAALLAGFDSQRGALPAQNTSANISALINQTYVSQVVAILQAAPFSCTSSNPLAIAAGSGGCDASFAAAAAKFAGFAIGAQNSVQNYTSVIPGLARTEFERHFGFTASESGNPTPMNFETGFGSSGSLYINLQNFINSRDKNLQSQIDLVNLIDSLGGIKVDGTNPTFKTSEIYLVGHSLGTVAASGAAAVTNQSTNINDVTATVLYTPASGITRLLENSPEFAPRILAGLSAAGVSQGTQNYETFMRIVQTAIDPADPINLADDLSSSGQNLMTFNVVGTEDGNGNTLYKSDQVTIIEAAKTQFNDAFPDYLAGGIPLAEALGATNVVTASSGTNVTANLAYGTHSMFVLPSENTDIADSTQRAADLQRQKDAFTEALFQTTTFFGGSIGPVDANTGVSTSPTPSTQPILDDRPLPIAKDVIDNDDSDEFKQLN